MLALGEETAVQAVVGSIVWALRKLKKPRCREVSARGDALHSVCPQDSFPFSCWCFAMVTGYQVVNQIPRRKCVSDSRSQLVSGDKDALHFNTTQYAVKYLKCAALHECPKLPTLSWYVVRDSGPHFHLLCPSLAEFSLFVLVTTAII